MALSEDYVRHWFTHHALSTSTPTLRALAREWILETAEARPGFLAQLRQVALESVSGQDWSLVRRGILALAVVGISEDLPLLESFEASSDERLAADARYATFEIKHRAV
jgi:hypothetical protein